MYSRAPAARAPSGRACTPPSLSSAACASTASPYVIPPRLAERSVARNVAAFEGAAHARLPSVPTPNAELFGGEVDDADAPAGAHVGRAHGLNGTQRGEDAIHAVVAAASGLAVEVGSEEHSRTISDNGVALRLR